MELYILPSIFAISAKIAVLILGRRALLSVDKSLLLFLLGLFGVNVFELALLTAVPRPDNTFLLLSLYYGSVVITNGAWIYYVLRLKGWLSPNVKHGLYALHLAALAILAVPGLVLQGSESIGYSITRVPGPLYPLLQLVIVGGLAVTLVALLRARAEGDASTRKKAMVLLVATAPLMVSVATVVILMQLGFAVNATIVTSLATSFMMAVLMYTECRYRLFKFLAVIPNTDEYRQWSAVSELLNKPDVSLKEAQAAFTAMFVEQAVRRSEGNQVKAAKAMNTSRTTVHRYLKNGKDEVNAETLSQVNTD